MGEVVPTTPAAPAKPWDDPIEEWSDMGGVQRDGLFTLPHATEMGSAPVGAPAPMAVAEPLRRSKERGEEKDVRPMLAKLTAVAAPAQAVTAAATAPIRSTPSTQRQWRQ